MYTNPFGFINDIQVGDQAFKAPNFRTDLHIISCPDVLSLAVPHNSSRDSPQPEVGFLPNLQGKPKLIINQDVGRIFLLPSLLFSHKPLPWCLFYKSD